MTDIRQFGEFLHSLDEGLGWPDVDGDLVRAWVMRLMSDGTRASTINVKLSSVRSFYRFLLLTERITSDPVRLVRGPKKNKPLPTFVREGEMNRLLDVMGHGKNAFQVSRNRLIVLLLYMTGIRRAELIGLDIEDVDVASNQIKVTGKRNKQRIVPIGTEVVEAVKAYIDQRRRKDCPDARAFFISNMGARISPGQVEVIVHDALSRVTTLPKRSPHVLRHTFATGMLNGGADLQSVKEILGHESVATTEVYTHTTFEHLREVYRNSHPRA